MQNKYKSFFLRYKIRTNQRFNNLPNTHLYNVLSLLAFYGLVIYQIPTYLVSPLASMIKLHLPSESWKGNEWFWDKYLIKTELKKWFFHVLILESIYQKLYKYDATILFLRQNHHSHSLHSALLHSALTETFHFLNNIILCIT